MSERFREATSDAPCPAYKKPDWCGWTADHWLKCERCTDSLPGMKLVKHIDGGALFRSSDDGVHVNHLAPKARSKSKLGRIAATYDYSDASGKLLYQSVRYDPTDFRQRRPDGKGGWTWKLGDVQRVLYRLPELLAADPSHTLFIPEGEKDVDALAGLGLIATCNVSGAGKWHLIDDTPLHGRPVVILLDYEDAGRKHAEQVAGSLHGKAASVEVLALPGLPERGDVTDWLAADGTVDELQRLVDATPEYEPTATKPTTGKSSSRAMVVRLADVTPEPIRSLWAGRIPCGMFTLLFGDPGLGKSFLTLDLAARVSCGRTWPNRADNIREGVVLLSAEDDVTFTIRPRLEAARADMSRIITIQGVKRADEQGGESRSYFSLETDLPALGDAIRSMPDTRLVIIDPISAYCGGVNGYRNTDVRGLLVPLSELAAETGIVLVWVTHLNKTAARKALYRTTGSLAYVAAAPAGWLVIQDPDNQKRRLLLLAKMNVAPSMPGMASLLNRSTSTGLVRQDACAGRLTR